MIVSIPELKARFAAGDMPSAKDFSDLIDSILSSAINGTSAAITAAVIAAIASIPTSATLIVQSSPPNASHATSLWVQTDPASGTAMNVFRFSSVDSAWHCRHPLPPLVGVIVSKNTFDVMQIGTFDGGTVSGGPMWEVDTSMSGKFPLGVSGAYGYNTSGGAATHLLLISELPAHSHTITHVNSSNSSGSALSGAATPSTMAPAPASTDNAGGGTAFPILPPYQTCYFLRRTSRLDYIYAPGA